MTEEDLETTEGEDVDLVVILLELTGGLGGTRQGVREGKVSKPSPFDEGMDPFFPD